MRNSQEERTDFARTTFEGEQRAGGPSGPPALFFQATTTADTGASSLRENADKHEHAVGSETLVSNALELQQAARLRRVERRAEEVPLRAFATRLADEP